MPAWSTLGAMHPAVRGLVRLRTPLSGRPRLTDLALTLLAGALTAAPLFGARHVPWWAGLLVAAECLPLLWRRRWPFPVALAVGTVTVAHSLSAIPEPVLPWASLLAVCTVAADAPRRLALLTAALLAVVLPVVLVLQPQPAGVESFLASGVVYAAAWLLGDAARHRRERTALLEQQAVADERNRMAREMHDVLGHHLSLVIVQAEAGPPLLRRSPAAAEQAFAAISDTSRQALDELRQVIGTLRGTSAGEARPGVAVLPELLDRVRDGGVHVDHQVTGPVVPLPAAADRAAFRVVQEALTIVVRHGATPSATVEMRYTTDIVYLSIHNPGRAASVRPGTGLIGMRERVAAVGGRFHAGPVPDGGWQVTAHLPLRGTA